MVLLRCCVALYGGVSRVCVFVIPSVMSCCRALAHGVLCHWFSAMFGMLHSVMPFTSVGSAGRAIPFGMLAMDMESRGCTGS